MILLTLMLSVASPAPVATPSPYVIYTKALEHLTTLQDPPYIIETQRQITVTLRDGEVHDKTDNVARYVFDTRTRLECGFFLPFNKADQPYIGPSYFGPDTWLVRKGFRQAQPSHAALAPDLSDVRTIASVTAVERPSYEVRLAGITVLNHGGTAYHLLLKPLYDPVRHNLRELWIDTKTYDIVRAVIEGAYKYDPTDVAEDVFVTEDFGDVGGYWLVVHKTWSYAKPFSPVSYRFDYTTLSMRFASRVPSWLFSRKAFYEHTPDPRDALFKDLTTTRQ